MEQPLLPYEQCVLGALNLPNFIKDGHIDYPALNETIRIAVRLLDNAIDKNNYPTSKIEEKALDYRKIGIGVMGFGELLIRLGVRYGSEKSLRIAEDLSEFINNVAITKSEELAEEKEPFLLFRDTDIETPRRNAVLTTVAPTGSRSIIANTTSGIEPLYSIENYTHEDGDGTIREFDFDFMADADPECLVDAHSINYEDHVNMQASWQKHIGASISKTINMHENTTVETVKKAFKMAFKSGCKGLTIYRNKSRQKQVLTTNNDQKSDRPTITSGITEKTKIGCGKLYITVNADENEIMEVFTTTGKGGGCHAQSEAISRLVSLGLRKGVDKEDIIDQLKGIRCEAALVKKDVHNLSCPDAIARSLERAKFNKDNRAVVMADNIKRIPEKQVECPVCGASLERDSGCETCRKCGWSACQ